MSRIVYILLFILTIPLSVQAQNKKDSLTMRVSALEKELAQKNAEISKLETKLSDAEAKINSLKESTKNSSYKIKIEELERHIESLIQDSLYLVSQIDTIKKINRNKNTEYSELKKKNAKIIDSLQKEIIVLKKIKSIYLAQMSENAGKDFFDKPFSKIDSAQLTKTCNEFAEYAADDPKIAETSAKLNSLKNDYLIYSQAIKALNSVYDYNVVQKILIPTRAIRDKTPENQKEKKDELETLAWQLNNYKSFVLDFKNTVAAVEKSIGRNPTNTWDYVNDILQERKEGLQVIPYLSKLYAEYESALEADCFGAKVTEIANKVKNINTDN